MTTNLTRGGLTPATITNTITNEVVKFMFNPYEYTISKSNTWQDKPVSGLNLPMVTFQQGGAQTLSLTLHFDSQAAKADVRGFSPMIREVLRTKRMPPYHSDSHGSVWTDDMRLSDAQVKTIVNWIEAGSPRGEGQDPLPEAAKPAPKWPLGEPDVVVAREGRE